MAPKIDNSAANTDKKCEVHGTTLQPMRVPVSYGLPPRDHELLKARKTLFPHAWSYVLGGCVIDFDKKDAEVLVCQHCREAEVAWNEANRPDRNEPLAGFLDDQSKRLSDEEDRRMIEEFLNDPVVKKAGEKWAKIQEEKARLREEVENLEIETDWVS